MAKEKSSKKTSNLLDDPKIVVALLSFIIVVVMALSAYNIKKIQEKGEQVKAQEAMLTQVEERADFLKALRANAPTYMKLQEEYKLMMPEVINSEYEVLDSVCTMAEQYGLILSSVETPVVEQTVAKTVSVTLEVSGEYRNIVNFCNHLVYGQKQIYRIDGFSTERGSTDTFSRNATIVISTFAKA